MGWLGWVLAFYGGYMVGCKQKNGFLVSLVGEIVLIVHGCIISDLSLVVACHAWAVLMMWNYFKWRGQEYDERIQKENQAGRAVGSG
jgi:hypothetical protein